MAGELNTSYNAGLTIYGRALSLRTGFWWNGTAMEAYNASHVASYAIAMPAISTGSTDYQANAPALPRDLYRIDYYRQFGSSPAVTDRRIDSEARFDWTGTKLRAQADLVDGSGSPVLDSLGVLAAVSSTLIGSTLTNVVYSSAAPWTITVTSCNQAGVAVAVMVTTFTDATFSKVQSRSVTALENLPS